jgi:hypothetical protein
MANVFYIECSGEIWRKVAQACAGRGGWKPSLWTAGEADRDEVRALFRDVAFMSGPDAALALDPPAWPVAPVSEGDLRMLASYEPTALMMMDRMDGAGVFDIGARRAHFRQLVQIWTGALEHFRPRRVVFSLAPHLVFDYVLYALCRSRGIPTLMFERHGLPGWVFTLDAIDAPPKALERALASGEPGPLPAVYARWLQSLSAGAENAVPANFAKKLAAYKTKGRQADSLLRGLVFELKQATVLLLRHGPAGSRNSYLRSAKSPHGRARWLETLGMRLRGLLKKRRLARQLRRLATGPVQGEDYVLLALHYQPERSTVPLGGIFGDQLFIVGMLSRALPDGWKLYVREHPWQLQPYGRGELQRSEKFYACIARHANVRLLPIDAPTAALIDAARAVATVSGSVGWQALCRGVPALVFGEAWYRLCGGCFRVREEADARQALSKIAKGYRVPHQAVERFAAALATICVPGVLEPAIESAEGLDVDAAAEAMAGALLGHRAA